MYCYILLECSLTSCEQYFTHIKHGGWVSNCCLAPIQLYHGENKLMFNEMKMTNTPSWLFIVLAHWNNSPRVDMSPHSDTFSWFRANQSLLFLLNAASLVESNKYLFYSLCFHTRSGLEPTIYRTRGEHANYYTMDAVLLSLRCDKTYKLISETSETKLL